MERTNNEALLIDETTCAGVVSFDQQIDGSLSGFLVDDLKRFRWFGSLQGTG
jgi:hypothetical protein